jgi:membrane protease YdiL (CAAX protease family)
MKSMRTLLIVLIFALGVRSLYSVLTKYFVPVPLLEESEILFRFIGKTIFYSILITAPVYLRIIKMSETGRIFGRNPNPWQILIAGFLGIVLLAFTYGEDGIEIFLLAQIDADLAYSLWDYPPTFAAPEHNFVNSVLVCLGAVIIAPFTEEFFFRGLLLSNLNRSFDKRWAAFGCSCLFTVLHYSNLNLISTMVFSLVLCRIYLMTGSLWICTIVHSIFNLGALLVENFALEKIVRSYEELPNFSSWKMMCILFMVSSCILIYARHRVKGIK